MGTDDKISNLIKNVRLILVEWITGDWEKMASHWNLEVNPNVSFFRIQARPFFYFAQFAKHTVTLCEFAGGFDPANKCTYTC